MAWAHTRMGNAASAIERWSDRTPPLPDQVSAWINPGSVAHRHALAPRVGAAEPAAAAALDGLQPARHLDLLHGMTALLQCLPGEPLMSTDNLRSMEVDNVASGQHPGLLDLGITASALEPVAALYLDGQGRADPLLRVRSAASGH